MMIMMMISMVVFFVRHDDNFECDDDGKNNFEYGDDDNACIMFQTNYCDYDDDDDDDDDVSTFSFLWSGAVV